MITGSNSINRVVERSICRSVDDSYFTDIADYKIHSTSLMPYIPFETSMTCGEIISNVIFLNDDETSLTFPVNINCQNYLTAGFVGRAPLEHYGPPTPAGREFVLICSGGDPGYSKRSFGTEGSVSAYNQNANSNSKLPTT